MSYIDSKIQVLGSGKDFRRKSGGYVQLSQLIGLPAWVGRIENGWQQKLVQMDDGYYFRIDMRIPPIPPTPLDTWHIPPEDPSDYDPNYQAIILTPTEAYQWLTREGYDIPDDLIKLKTSSEAGETNGGKTGSQSLDSQNKREDIVELKPNFCGIGLNINALIRKKELWIKIKNMFYRIFRPK
jgi:hypothetical protein